jgi:hypothetical protein
MFSFVKRWDDQEAMAREMTRQMGEAVDAAEKRATEETRRLAENEYQARQRAAAAAKAQLLNTALLELQLDDVRHSVVDYDVHSSSTIGHSVVDLSTHQGAEFEQGADLPQGVDPAKLQLNAQGGLSGVQHHSHLYFGAAFGESGYGDSLGTPPPPPPPPSRQASAQIDEEADSSKGCASPHGGSPQASFFGAKGGCREGQQDEGGDEGGSARRSGDEGGSSEGSGNGTENGDYGIDSATHNTGMKTPPGPTGMKTPPGNPAEVDCRGVVAVDGGGDVRGDGADVGGQVAALQEFQMAGMWVPEQEAQAKSSVAQKYLIQLQQLQRLQEQENRRNAKQITPVQKNRGGREEQEKDEETDEKVGGEETEEKMRGSDETDEKAERGGWEGGEESDETEVAGASFCEAIASPLSPRSPGSPFDLSMSAVPEKHTDDYNAV